MMNRGAMKTLTRIGLVFFGLLIIAGCGAKQPVLYTNAQLNKAGGEQSRRDIDECDRLAGEYVKSNPGLNTAKSTGLGAVAGAVVGGAIGAVTGDFSRSVASGAAGGGASGFLHGLFKSSETSPVHKNYVERCLRDRGYEVIGWD